MSTKGFSLAFIAVTLAILAVVGLFNRIVDPYWYFREVEIVGFNHVKPHAVGNERLVKPALVNKLSPDVIILGNSVAEIGLPPTHRGLTNDGTLVRTTWRCRERAGPRSIALRCSSCAKRRSNG